MKHWGCLIWMMAWSIACGPAQAELDPAQAADRAAIMLEAAALSLSEADGARNRVEALTETVRAYEEGLLALREGIRRAALREQTIETVFEAERARLASLLGVLQSIERAPVPLLMIHPSGPVGTARSGMILSDVTPAVASEAEELRSQLQELQSMRSLQSRALDQMAVALQDVQSARSELSQAIADRRQLPVRFSLNPDALRQIIESVDSLGSFAEMLRDSSSPDLADPALPDFDAARGVLPLPAIGRQLRGFNEEDAAGIARPGLVLATGPRALVTNPWPATVRYAGPLLDYGNVVILEPDGDFLLVIAGIGEVFVQLGDVVGTSAPLALMGGAAPDSEELIVTSSQGGGADLSETLYIELRQAGEPTDPSEWFATQ